MAPMAAMFGSMAARGYGFGAGGAPAIPTMRFCVGIGETAGIKYTDNLTTWTNASGTTLSNSIRYIGRGPDKFIAVRNALSASLSVVHSDYGNIWAVASIPGGVAGSYFGYSASFARDAYFVGLSGSGSNSTAILRSVDGMTFSLIVLSSTLSGTFCSVAAITSPSPLYVVTTQYGGVYTSADGVTWGGPTAVPGQEVNGLAASATTFVCLSGTGVGANVGAYHSTNGTTWTKATLPNGDLPDSNGNVISYVEGLFYIFQRQANFVDYYTSPDGINWTARTMTTTQSYAAPSPVTFSGGQYMIVSASDAGGTMVWYTSPTGLDTWTQRGPLASTTPYGAAGYVSADMLRGSEDKLPNASAPAEAAGISPLPAIARLQAIVGSLQTDVSRILQFLKDKFP